MLKKYYNNIITDDKIEISLSNNIIYTFKPQTNNSNNNKIRFFLAQEDNKNVKSNYFDSKITISYKPKISNNNRDKALQNVSSNINP